MRLAAAVEQRGIAWRRCVRMQRLQRIYQDAGDIAAGADDTQRFFRHILKRVGLVRRQRVADAGLHVAPPAMIGATEPHQVRSPRMIACQPNRLHDSFGARHMKRDLIETRELLEHLYVLDDQGMIGAEHRTKLAHPRSAALDRLFVEVVAEEVYAVGTADIVEAIAVEISNGHAFARLHEGGGGQVGAYVAVVLERHPVGVGELQVRDAFSRFGGAPDRFGKARVVKSRQPGEPCTAARNNVLRRSVGTEESRLVVFVKRHEPRKPPRDPCMTGDRFMFGLRKLETPPQCYQRGRERRSADPVKRQCRHGQCHRIAVYPPELTSP